MDQEGLRNAITLVNSGKKYPALQLIKKDPETAAVISKMVRPRNPSERSKDTADAAARLNQSQIQAISESTKTRASDNENTMQLFPDIELCAQVLISSILSPKDMVKTEVIYKAKEPIMPSELILKLSSVVAKHLEGHYRVLDDLPTILRESLFSTGSYIRAIIPESIVDELINSNKGISTESLTELFTGDKVTNIGLLGNPGTSKPKVALEHFYGGETYRKYEAAVTAPTIGNEATVDFKLEVTDNFRLLKLPKLIEAHRTARIKEIIGKRSYATEESTLSSAELANLLYKNQAQQSDPFITIPSKINAKRKSIGRPLVMKLPSSSVIPAFTPGDESKHIGYFLLVDADGYPVTDSEEAVNGPDGLAGLANGQGGNVSLSSLLIKKAQRNLESSGKAPTIDGITKVYANIIENDLVERLRNGVYGGEVTIGGNEEIYRIMLARALSSKFTRLVFIPAELVSYYAFKYYPNGVGKSLLDDLKIITSLRSMLLFAKVMALTKNSIGVTHVQMTLDPNDPDPDRTIELAMHEVASKLQLDFPLGINSASDLVNWLQRSGIQFSFDGHPGLPGVKFDFENKSLQHTIPDSDLEELLRKVTYMALGLSPETVDNGFNSEFATTVVSNNILLSKRVLQYQNVLIPLLSEDCRRLISNDAVAEDELLDVLEQNKGLLEKSLSDEERELYNKNQKAFMRDMLDRFLENMLVELPKPDITALTTQTTAYDEYIESLEKTLDAWLNADFITSDIAGDISGSIDAVKAMAKAHFSRRWMSENGFMPELNDLITNDEDGRPTLDLYDVNKNHVEGLMRSILKYVEALSAAKNAANKDLENLGSEGGDDTGGDESDTSDEDIGGGNEEEAGDLDNAGEEPPPDEEEPAEDTEKQPENEEAEEEPKPASDNVGL